ncbi:MAG TPA: formyltransferase family protein [Azospirillum sp.]
MGLHLLEALLRTRHRVAGVLATPDGPSAGGDSVEQAARRLGLATWPAERVCAGDFAEAVWAARVDVLFNAQSPHVVCPDVLDAPRLGAYALHPGPLPRYPGRHAPQWALFHGERRHAVTVHAMNPQVGRGPIAAHAEFPIEADDTALTLTMACVRHGVPLALGIVDALARDPRSVPCDPMPEGSRVPCGFEPPNGGWIAWDWPAATVDGFVRACDFDPLTSPWGRPRTLHRGQRVALTKAKRTGRRAAAAPGIVTAVEGQGARVACADEELLVTELLVGDRRLPAADRLAPGDHLFAPPLSSEAA